MKKLLFILLLLSFAAGLAAQAPRLVVPIAHASKINAIAFLPDGQKVLTASDDGTAKLWDTLGRELVNYAGHTRRVTAVAYLPAGQKVLTASTDKTVKLWDLSGREILTFEGHTNEVLAAAFSPDGQKFLTGSADATAKLLNLSGREIQTFKGHTDAVLSVAFSPDGQKILTGSRDKTAKLWDLSGHVIHTFQGHSAWVGSVAFSPDGQKVLTGGGDNTVKLWDLSGREILTITGHTREVTAAAFSPDGQNILTGSFDESAKLWDLSGREIKNYGGYTFGVGAVAFSSDGQKIMVSNMHRQARMMDISGREIHYYIEHALTVRPVAFSPDGRRVLMGSGDLTAKLWDLSGREIQSFKGHTSYLYTVAFSPDGQKILTGAVDGTARLWDLSGRELQTIKAHANGVSSGVFSPDGQMVLTGGKDGTARLWDLSGREIQVFSGHSDHVLSVAFSPDGQKVFTGCSDRTARLWDLSGNVIQTFEGHTGWVGSVAFSPDGKNVLTGGGDGTANLWDLSGNVIQTFKGHTEWISSVAFSPDGKKVLTGSVDKTARLWDLSGKVLQVCKGHPLGILSVAFSPDGNTVLTGSDDNTAKLWDSNSGQCLATLIVINPSDYWANNSKDWVVTSPSGLFDASPGAIKIMYYTQGFEVIDLEQLKERYYEPGLLSKLTGLNQDPLRSAEAFNAVPLYPEMNASFSEDKRTLQVGIKPRNGGIGKLSFFVNGKEVREDANPQRAESVTIDLTAFADYYLPGNTNKLTLRVYNQAGWLKSPELILDYQPPATARGGTTGAPVPAPNSLSGKTKPALYAVVVGTANYAGDKLDLKFADRDASLFCQALRAAAPKVFADKVSITLLNTDPADKNRQDVSSKASIRKSFADVAAKAKAQDILLIYFSGHGVNYGAAENTQFYYLTKDIASENLTDPEIRNSYAISSAELTEWINAIPALKQVMVIDACNSGKIVEDLAVRKDLSSSQVRALDRMKDRTGMFILTGSAADKVSYEASQYGQGLLTYSLLQGMSGLALTADNRVDVMSLFQFSRDKVPDLAKGIGGVQTPVLAIPADGSSFDIGIVDASVKIPLAQVKPVFIRNIFQDEDTFDDALGLTPALAAYFQQITLQGARASLIYVDVPEYENAYSMKGRYKQNGDVVEVRGRLFKGKTAKGEFQVTGKKSNLPGLVEAIVEKVSGMVE